MTAEGAIPAEFSSFIGRGDEVAELAALLPDVRALTLCGAGGIGKTRLALRLLTALSADYPDGIWFVDLGELQRPELVVATVAAVVGVDEEPGRALTDTLADAVRYRQALLALDNCEHLIEACASLCQRLLADAPHLTVLATSREPLHVAAETVWPVPPLALPPEGVTSPADLLGYDSVRLFAERAAAAAPGFRITQENAAGVARICRALDGLPLAIELAAAWLRVLSLEQIAARIRDRFALLTGAHRSVPARQQTLRAAIDWSYDMLTDAQRILLRRLSVFVEWSLDMAEEVCADELLPAGEILDTITALADKSLLDVGPEVLGQARYRLLETVREYAAGELAAAGEAEKFLDRRRDYTLSETLKLFAKGMGLTPGPAELADVVRRFDVESANIQEVLAHSLTTGDGETGLRICQAMSPVMIMRGNFSQHAGWIEAFLSVGSQVPESVIASILAVRAQLALASGSGQAEELAREALAACRAAGDRFYEASTLNLLTEIALHAGRLDDAEASGVDALAVSSASADRWNAAYAMGTLSTLAAFRGKLREAAGLADVALAGMRAIEQDWGIARALLGLGDLARLRGDHPTARQHYLQALSYLRELNSRPDTARCLAGLGRIAIDQGDLAAARDYLSESLEHSFASGSRIGMARGLEAMARLSVLEGEPATAVQLAGAFTALRLAAGLPEVPGARMQRLLDSAADVGPHEITRLWAEGAALSPADAIAVATGDGGARSGGVVPVQRPALQSLTAREREVVALIAAGKSNRQIASELYISTATAARHVANIFAKLGYTSRSQVAVWAKSAEPPAAAHRSALPRQPAPNKALTDSPS
jgi:predicted ATPase/DNA-binding CsgD family transcriptional regulator